MPETRVTMGRVNPGIRNASWNRPREGAQDIQEIAGAREWAEPNKTRDDIGETRVVEKVGPLATTAFVGAREQSDIQIETFSTETASIRPGGVGADTDTRCLLCQRSESECAVLVELHSGHICDQCTEEAVDAVRQELPKRRLRLAMERMLAGQVTPEMVAEVERLSGGKGG